MADKNKKNQNQNQNQTQNQSMNRTSHDTQESDSKNQVDMLNGNQIDERAKNPAKKDWESKKKDEIL